MADLDRFCVRCDGNLKVVDHQRGIIVPCPLCQPLSAADFTMHLDGGPDAS